MGNVMANRLRESWGGTRQRSKNLSWWKCSKLSGESERSSI